MQRGHYFQRRERFQDKDDSVEHSRSLRERKYIFPYHSQPIILFPKSSKDGHMILHQQHFHPSVMFSNSRYTDRLGFYDHFTPSEVSKYVWKWFCQKVPMKRLNSPQQVKIKGFFYIHLYLVKTFSTSYQKEVSSIF